MRETQNSSANLDFFSSNLRVYALKKYIYGLRSYGTDEYYENNTAVDIYSPVYACKFGRSLGTFSLLALAYEDGRFALQQTFGPDEGRYVANKKAHENAVFDISWIHNKAEFVAAVADSSLSLWSVREDLTHIQQFKGHTKWVKCVDANTWDSNVIASGGRDCKIIIWDKRCLPTNKANEITDAHSSQRCLNSPRPSHSSSSNTQNCVISVLFSEQSRLLSAGASDGLIKIWDLRKTYGWAKRESTSLYTLEYNGHSSCKGFTSMSLSPSAERVYVSCLDGNIYAYHLANPTYEPVARYYGHRSSSYYSKSCLSPCGRVLLSGSSDDKAYMWLTSSPGNPIALLAGHFDEVTSVAWSSDRYERVVTCSDDLKHRIFKYNAQEESEGDMGQEVLGFAVPFVGKKLRGQSPTSRNKNINIKSSNFPISEEHFTASNSVEKSSGEILPCTSQRQITPLRIQLRSNSRHVTPNTSERKTLLSWLSCSKTPKDLSLQSPGSQTTATRSNLIGRKVSDAREINQENLRNENEKPVASPRKNVLNEVKRNNCVAKMLKYEDTEFKSEQPNVEDSESFRLLDDLEKNKADDGVSSSFFNGSLNSQMRIDARTPVKLLHNTENLNSTYMSPDRGIGGLPLLTISSPTANLPNYMLDGRSPHCRRETPLAKNHRPDWLTSLKRKSEVAHAPSEVKEKTRKNKVKRVNSVSKRRRK